MHASLDLGRIPFFGKGTGHPNILGRATDLRNQTIARSPLPPSSVRCVNRGGTQISE